MHILSGIYREILSSMNTQRELGVSSFQIVHVYLHYLHLLFLLPTQLKLHVTVKNFLQINIIITHQYKLHLYPSNEPEPADEPGLKRYWDELVLPSERLDSSSNMKTALPRSHGTNYDASTRCL